MVSVSTIFHINFLPHMRWPMKHEHFQSVFCKYCQMNASLEAWDALAANLPTVNYISDIYIYASWICTSLLEN